MTLDEARQQFHAGLSKGTRCPCCGRFSKVYKRKLHAGITRALILLNRYFSRPDALPWVHIQTFLTTCRVTTARDFSFLVHWGFLEKHQGHAEDGNPNNGYYRITALGRAFAEGRVTAPAHAHILNDVVLHFSSDRITVRQALGKHFDYDELMHT